MSIPTSHMKERMSAAYVQAVAARAGIALKGDNVTEYGIDGYFYKIRRLPDGKYKETGIPIQYQLKATESSSIKDNEVVYDMKVKAYNKLVDVVDDDPPTIFILFRIPPEAEIGTWLVLDHDMLVMKHCCYWDYITGSRLDDKKDDSTHRIKIPIEQRLTPEAINNFFVMLKEGKI